MSAWSCGSINRGNRRLFFIMIALSIDTGSLGNFIMLVHQLITSISPKSYWKLKGLLIVMLCSATDDFHLSMVSQRQLSGNGPRQLMMPAANRLSPIIVMPPRCRASALFFHSYLPLDKPNVSFSALSSYVFTLLTLAYNSYFYFLALSQWSSSCCNTASTALSAYCFCLRSIYDYISCFSAR